MLFSRGLFFYWENFQRATFGPAMRTIGQRLLKIGNNVQGEFLNADRLVPSTRCIPTSSNVFPRLLESEWIATNATIIGDVQTGKYSSVFHGVNIRGDTCKVNIGSKTVIQDNTILVNSSKNNAEEKIVIGDKVVIGVNCRIDVCTIEDNVYIGNGVTIHKGCYIQNGAMIAPGAVLLPGTIVPYNQIWAGNPARYLRDIKPEEREALKANSTELRELANVLVEESEKDHIEQIRDEYYRAVNQEKTDKERMADEIRSVSMLLDNKVDDFGVESSFEGYDSLEGEDLIHYMAPTKFQKENMDLLYEQDLTHYPDAFKIYGENFERSENIRKKYERDYSATNASQRPEILTERPGAMRAWISKWDPDFNTVFKAQGSANEHTN